MAEPLLFVCTGSRSSGDSAGLCRPQPGPSRLGRMWRTVSVVERAGAPERCGCGRARGLRQLAGGPGSRRLGRRAPGDGTRERMSAPPPGNLLRTSARRDRVRARSGEGRGPPPDARTSGASAAATSRGSLAPDIGLCPYFSFIARSNAARPSLGNCLRKYDTDRS